MKYRTEWVSKAVADKYFDIKLNDKRVFKKLKSLYKSICASPYKGEGHPHPLRENYQGWWSRHITGPNTIIYRVVGEVLYIKELNIDYHRNKASDLDGIWDPSLDEAFGADSLR